MADFFSEMFYTSFYIHITLQQDAVATVMLRENIF